MWPSLVCLMGQEKERFLRKGDACIVATDLVGKSDCFSDIWCSWKLTHSFIPNSFDVSGIDTGFKSWIFSLKQGETIRTINYCSLSQFHKQKSRKEPKKLGDFQNVSDSEVHDFPFVSSVHCSLMYLVFCVSRAISGVCFSRGWPFNGHNYAHCAFFVW